MWRKVLWKVREKVHERRVEGERATRKRHAGVTPNELQDREVRRGDAMLAQPRGEGKGLEWSVVEWSEFS